MSPVRKLNLNEAMGGQTLLGAPQVSLEMQRMTLEQIRTQRQIDRMKLTLKSNRVQSCSSTIFSQENKKTGQSTTLD